SIRQQLCAKTRKRIGKQPKVADFSTPPVSLKSDEGGKRSENRGASWRLHAGRSIESKARIMMMGAVKSKHNSRNLSCFSIRFVRIGSDHFGLEHGLGELDSFLAGHVRSDHNEPILPGEGATTPCAKSNCYPRVGIV